MTDTELREVWTLAGGRFYGPNIEHGTMEVKSLLPFLRSLKESEAKLQLTDEAFTDLHRVAFNHHTFDQLREAVARFIRRVTD